MGVTEKGRKTDKFRGGVGVMRPKCRGGGFTEKVRKTKKSR